MPKLMKYDADKQEWIQMKLSEVLNRNVKFYINDEWIPIAELVEDDTNGD
jgi:hypothetical protein